MEPKAMASESFGRFNISPSQVASIIDHYLSANNFSLTRATFRMEASSLFANSPVNQISKNMVNLEKMLDDYVSLKTQQLLLDQARLEVTQEKIRVQKFWQGTENVLNTYNVSPRPTVSNDVLMNGTSAVVPPFRVCNKITSGVFKNTSTTIPIQNPLKRVATQAIEKPVIAKRPRGRPRGKKNQVQVQDRLPLFNNKVVLDPSSATIQSSVQNCKFTGPSVLPSPETHSFHGYPDVSPIYDISPVATCNGKFVTHCEGETSTKRAKVMVEPENPHTDKESLPIPPMEGNTDKTSNREVNLNTSNVFQSLEISTPNEGTPPCKEIEEDWPPVKFLDSDIDDIDFSNLRTYLSDHEVAAHSKDNA